MYTYPAKPVSVLLAAMIASSSVSKTVMGATGQKISSVRTRDSRGTSRRTVGLNPPQVAAVHASSAWVGQRPQPAESRLHDDRQARRTDVSRFPPPVAGDAVVGEVVASASAATELPAGIVVVAGGPDGTVGTAAIAGTADDVVVDLAGTTDVVTRVTRMLLDPPASAVLNPYVTSNTWSYGGPTGMTGSAVSYMSHLLGLGDVEAAMTAGALQWDGAGVGSAGLLVAPSLSGERFPRWRHDRAAAVIGLRERHTPMHLLRATQEAAAFTVREGVDLLAGPRDQAVAVVLAGGVSRSGLLAQLRADVLGRPILVCREPDVTLLGAIALASVGAGLYASVDEATATISLVLDRVDSDPPTSAGYDEVYARWATTAMA